MFEDAPQLEKLEFFAYDVDGEQEDESIELIGMAKTPSIVIELDCNYGRVLSSAAQAQDESDTLSQQMHEMEAQKLSKDRQWESLRKDEFGEGDWHWHSAPLLSLREDIGDRKYLEDDEGGDFLSFKGLPLASLSNGSTKGMGGKDGKKKGKDKKRRSKSSGQDAAGAEEENPLHSDSDAEQPISPSSSQSKLKKSGRRRKDRTRDADSAARDIDIFDRTEELDEFSNPIADDLRAADAPPPSAAPQAPKKKAKRGFMKKSQPASGGPKEVEFAPAGFEANPLADAIADVENPQTQPGAAETNGRPPPTPSKKKRKKKGKKELNFAEVENPMAMSDEEDAEV